MSKRTVFVALTIVALGSAGCGSSSKTASTTAAGSTLPGIKPAAVNKPPPPKSVTYNVVLAGFTGGATTGSGLAEIKITVPSDQLCWKFLQLANVPKPTVARVYRTFTGASGRGGISLGHTYTPSGCEQESAYHLAVIERKPQVIFLNVHSAEHPNGAVEGPLVPGGELPGAAATTAAEEAGKPQAGGVPTPSGGTPTP